MDFGYLIFVNENNESNYSTLAYALALSIKNTQKEGYDKVALVINNRKYISNYKSTWVFDKIIELDDMPEGWDVRSNMDLVTPWEYTVCLDADMLFFRDYSHWVEYFIKNTELYIANKAYTYRGDVVTSDYYRQTFTKNDLPNLYSFYTFFKRGCYKEFFELQRAIIAEPEKYSNEFLTNKKPKVVGTDEAFALAAKILDIQNEISFPLEFPRVVHLKGMIQDWPYPADSVTDHVGLYIDRKGNMKVGNYQQTDIMHYVEKSKITLETINVLEEIAWKTKEEV
jgi:hypothetical protein